MIIARFSLFGFLATQTGLLGLTFWLWSVLLRGVPDRYGVPPSHNPLFWIFLPFTPFFLWAAFSQAWQFLFRGGRAVWSDRDTLYYFPRIAMRPIVAIPLGSIKGFSAATYVGRLWVNFHIIRIETGNRKWDDDFLTWPLSEPREVVLARLNQVLADK